MTRSHSPPAQPELLSQSSKRPASDELVEIQTDRAIFEGPLIQAPAESGDPWQVAIRNSRSRKWELWSIPRRCVKKVTVSG